MSPRSYGVQVAVIGDRVSVSGELDQATFPSVMVRLEPSLRSDTVALDLSGVAFLSIGTALEVLELTQHPLRQGCELVVIRSSHAVDRAFELAQRVLDARTGH